MCSQYTDYVVNICEWLYLVRKDLLVAAGPTVHPTGQQNCEFKRVSITALFSSNKICACWRDARALLVDCLSKESDDMLNAQLTPSDKESVLISSQCTDSPHHAHFTAARWEEITAN